MATGTAECRGSWLTTNAAEPLPRANPAILNAGWRVPTALHGGSTVVAGPNLSQCLENGRGIK